MPPPTIRSILAASDLSASSDAILRAADGLAARTGAALHVVTAIDLQGGDPPTPAEREENEHALEAQLRRLFPGRIPDASRRVVFDAPDRVVLERAREVDAELIVLGPHRGGSVHAHFLGTTADRVIRTSGLPCLVVPGDLSLPLRRVGVPTDFSGPARRALEVALAWSAHLDGAAAEVQVVHAARSPGRTDARDPEQEGVRLRLEEEIRRALESADGVDPARVCPEVVWSARPADEIAAWAERQGTDLLVVGTRGEGEGALGSTASGLALRARCPVLLVPPG